MNRLTAKAVARVLDYQRGAARDPTKLGSEVQRGEESADPGTRSAPPVPPGPTGLQGPKGIPAQRAAGSQDAPRLGTNRCHQMCYK